MAARGFGSNTYSYEPAIDINASGQIGLGFMESDTSGGVINAATEGFISTFVTGRLPTDPAGTMETPVLVSAGTGTANINGRIGDFSGMNVDPANNTFWHVNEFGGGGPTDIANFELVTFPPGISVTNGELLICGDQDNSDENDTFKLVRDSTDPTMLDVFRNNTTTTPTFQFPMSGINQINIYGGGGFNTLIVDDANGVINVPNIPQGITFNAGDPCPMSTLIVDGLAADPPMGEDGTGQLILQQTTGANPTVTSDVYSPGPVPGDGTSVITDSNGNKQYVYFTELTPVYDSVPAASLTVNGTNAANAINYIEGNDTTGSPNTAWGQVTVDNQEAMNFTNKDHLIINGLAGDDQTNLNNPNTPAGNTAGGLKDITVNGNDPTASDTLIVNGRVNVADTITYTPATTTSDTGSVAISGLPTVNFSGAEHLVINGQNGGPGLVADTLTINTANLSTGQTEILTPGSTFDSGHVDFHDRNGGTNPIAVPVDFTALGVGGNLTFADSGRDDNLIYNGTNLDDTFSVSAAGDVTLNNQIVVHTPSIAILTLAGLNGDDKFNVTGQTGATNFTGITVEGGDPSASDTVNLTGATGAVAVNFGDSTLGTNTTITGYGSTVTLSGVEVANLSLANAAGVHLCSDGERHGRERHNHLHSERRRRRHVQPGRPEHDI